ncbi:MAG TPA: D-alanyl-D-alanine carboxypeptidase [Albitalea sp.]|nr:D-alanyl-D-alanine carboxypeptidase [Albitalea sp.]
MKRRARAVWIWFAAMLCAALSHAGEPLPRELAAVLASSGLPLQSFGLYVRPVDGDGSTTLAELNAEQPFLMASTTKVVTSLAALDLLGPTHAWQMQAYATGPVVAGRLRGDLVLVGSSTGLTPAELTRWFRQMRGEGLSEVSGRIVLDGVALLREEPPPAPEDLGDAVPEPAAARGNELIVSIEPGTGERAQVDVRPRPLDLRVIDDVFMGDGCNAWAQWRQERPGATPQLWVRGQWEAGCGRRDVAQVRPSAPLRFAPRAQPSPPGLTAARMVAGLWAEAGGRLGRGVVQRPGPARRPLAARLASAWTSHIATPLAEVIREMNKSSNNMSARHLLLALSPDTDAVGNALKRAQERVQGWLQAQGLADDDIRIDIGSGQSRLERGKPRALAQLLAKAWHGGGANAFLDSLPIAGVDGTLAQRLRNGAATGQAYLKTGTLHDTRALAGYVRGRSGKVYVIAAMVNHPRAAQATPALDKLVEWIARNG